MISFTIGLGLVLIGLYFNNLFATFFGAIILILALSDTRSKPMEEISKSQKIEKKHIVVMSEPPEQKIMPYEMVSLPLGSSQQVPNFLPLPNYGFSDPLEKVLLGIPVRFWKK